MPRVNKLIFLENRSTYSILSILFYILILTYYINIKKISSSELRDNIRKTHIIILKKFYFVLRFDAINIQMHVKELCRN